MFDSFDDARRKLAPGRYDHKNVRPHSSLIAFRLKLESPIRCRASRFRAIGDFRFLRLKAERISNKTPAEVRRTLEQFEGSAPRALAQNITEEYENQTRRLSL